jgi:hypothetical protein
VQVTKFSSRVLGALSIVCLMTVVAVPLRTQQGAPDDLATWVKANYTKFEYRIPMRDGVKLFTAVYIPKDASNYRTYPILMIRTPYGVGPYGADNYPGRLGPSDLFTRSKYIFVYQDVRGQMMSEGEYVNMRPINPDKKGTETDESSDTYDTVAWLLKNIPSNSGNVGIWGISYPGFYAAAGMINAHPAIRAVSPQAPIADWFIGDDFRHNGAVWLPHFFNFISGFDVPRPAPTTVRARAGIEHGTPDGYEFFKGIEPLSLADEKYFKHHVAYWDEFFQHPDYDAFWKACSLTQHVKNIHPAVLTVGGWFDAEDLYGTLHIFKAADRNNPQGSIRLVMGPWPHGGFANSDGDHLGDVQFASKTSVFFREHIEFPFFEYYLKERGEMNLPHAYVFETGTNSWREYDSWPPKNVTQKSLYLEAAHKLSFDAPHQTGDAFDEYTSDPAKPVPYYDKTNIDMAREYMDGDQRLQGRRTDVEVYETEPLDADITFAGPIEPSLEVSTTGTDADWVVKLIDVYPDNMPGDNARPGSRGAGGSTPMGHYEQLVRGEVMRGRYRNSFEKPEPFEPGKLAKVEFEMPDINHTFRTGHRIMVQVQSSWFPLVDINPQTFVNIYTAKPSDFHKAQMRVYHAPNAASHVDVWVLPEQPAPKSAQ